MKWWGVALVVVVGLAINAVVLGTLPKRGQPQLVTIKSGTSRLAIAKDLKNRGLIRSEADFLLLMLVRGGTIQAGTYQLDPNRNLVALTEILHQGKSQELTLTVPEGWRREQIAAQLTKIGLDGKGFLDATTGKEGYLFPDTYFLKPSSTPQDILDKFNTNFGQRTAQLQPTRDQVVLASIIEREAQSDADRAVIAGIFANRLKIGMALQSDATVQYAKDTNHLAAGEDVKKFWSEITAADYQAVSSPYNTYLQPGLPKGPICNPGLKSLEAAVHPAQTDALFFIYTKSGKFLTAKTLAEHQANLQKN